MFFILAKLFAFVALPSHFGLLLLIAIAILSFTRYARAARRLLVVFVLLLVAMMLGADQWAARPLENRFPTDPPLCQIDGIILLGGGEAPVLSRRRGQPLVFDRPGKYFEALALLHRFPSAKLLVAAGSASLDPGETRETDVAAAIFADAAIAPERILLESASRDTFENFNNALAMVHPSPSERWVLITGALHMPRAVAIARQVGFPVIAWPTDYRTLPTGTLISFNLAGALSELDNVFHEWVGLLVYRLTGRTSTLLPAPDPAATGCPTTQGG